MRMQEDRMDIERPILLKVGGSVLAHRHQTVLVAEAIANFHRPVISFGTGPLDSAWEEQHKKANHQLAHSFYVEILNHLQGINSAHFKSTLSEQYRKTVDVSSKATLPLQGEIGIVCAKAFWNELNFSKHLGGDVRAIVYAKALGVDLVVKVSNSPAFLDGFLAGEIPCGRVSAGQLIENECSYVDSGCIRQILQTGVEFVVIPFDQLTAFGKGEPSSFVHFVPDKV